MIALFLLNLSWCVAISEEAFQAVKKPKTNPDDQIVIVIDILANPINDGFVDPSITLCRIIIAFLLK